VPPRRLLTSSVVSAFFFFFFFFFFIYPEKLSFILAHLDAATSAQSRTGWVALLNMTANWGAHVVRIRNSSP
jgi:hypothetical protein